MPFTLLSVTLLLAQAAPAAVSVTAPTVAPVPTGKTAPPNFVVIFADDLGYGDLGCFGAPTIRTPHLDRMAAGGMKLTQFYTAASVCTPSRAGLLTGRLPVRSGMCGNRRVLFPDSASGLQKEEWTVAEALRAEGYATACVGKWHLGHLPDFLPTEHGFDSYFGIPYSNDMDAVHPLPKGAKKFKEPKSEYFNVPLLRDKDVIQRPADQTTITRRYTEEAVSFIEKNKDQPFFLYLAHNLPHVPLFRSEAFAGKSDRGLYGDVIEEIDWSVGQVLGALRDQGLDENTMVIFTSDNGPWLVYGDQGGSSGPLREGKGCTFEGGMRVPTVVRWPSKIPAGTVGTDLASTLDVLPTLVSLAGGTLPDSLVHDGHDLSGMLQGTAPSPRESVFYYQKTRLMAVRHGAYKAHFASHVSYVGAKLIEHDPPLLYNLDLDPSETRNLAKAKPEVIKELRLIAAKHLARTPVAPSQTAAQIRNKRKAPTKPAPKGPAKQSAPDPKRPNVVFIFADDMGPGEIEALNPGRSKVPTPHLNRLCAEGVSFTDAHTTSAVCTPSRYSLLTGRYNWRTSLQKGVLTGDTPALIAEDRATLGGLFQSQGYRTAAIGKWHLGYSYRSPDGAPAPTPKTKTLLPAGFPIGTRIVDGPITRGFDTFYGFHHAREMSSMVRNEVIVEELEVQDILPAITREAVGFIQAQAKSAAPDKPFFLYVPLSAPHTPIAPSKDWTGKSGIGKYGDFVAQTDGSVGAILAALDGSSLAANTIVIFSADNGTSKAAKIKQLHALGHFPSGPYRGSKADLWEGGHRVPFLVRWPGKVAPGSTSPRLVSMADVLATFADFFGTEVAEDAGEDSLSFLPALVGGSQGIQRESVVHHSISGHFAIRRGKWKLLLAPGSAGWTAPKNAAARAAGLPELQLYDLTSDVGETSNQITVHPEVAEELLAELSAIVTAGRSTPGTGQSNDAAVDIWKKN